MNSNKNNYLRVSCFVILILLTFWQCGDSSEQEETTHNNSHNNTTSVATKPKPFNINFMVENSLSMYGYFKVGNLFTTSVYSLLTDFSNAAYCNELNIGIMNGKGFNCLYPKATIKDCYTFQQILDPYKINQTAQSSDFKSLIRDVVNKADNKNVSVFVSDFIYSDKTPNPADFLPTLGVGVRALFDSCLLANPELAIMVLQLESDFNGQYFTTQHQTIRLNCKRPYYVWFVGNKNNLQQIKNDKAISHLDDKGLKNSMVFYKTGKIQSIDYTILGGNVNKDDLSNQIIENAEDENNGIFKFSVNVNLKNIPLTDHYLLDVANYQFPSNYQLKIKKIDNPKYSHTFQFSTKEFTNQDIELRLMNKLPLWIENANSDNDGEIDNNDSEKTKTFGLKYLLKDGLFSSFNSNENNVIANFKFKIEQ